MKSLFNRFCRVREWTFQNYVRVRILQWSLLVFIISRKFLSFFSSFLHLDIVIHIRWLGCIHPPRFLRMHKGLVFCVWHVSIITLFVDCVLCFCIVFVGSHFNIAIQFRDSLVDDGGQVCDLWSALGISECIGGLFYFSNKVLYLSKYVAVRC